MKHIRLLLIVIVANVTVLHGTELPNTIMAGGNVSSLYIKSDGSLWGAGNDTFGQLGDGFTEQQNVAIKVTDCVSAVSVGNNHSLILKTNGDLYAAGCNTSGQLGIGTFRQVSTLEFVSPDIMVISACADHSMFLKRDGTLWGMGNNDEGQLGDGTKVNKASPVRIDNNVISLSSGNGHNVYVKSDGSLWAVGRNYEGQLGNGTNMQVSRPVQVGTGVKLVAAGGFHTLFLRVDGTMWAMGENTDGQLGNGSVVGKNLPIQVANNVQMISAGLAHSMFLKVDNTLWVMGNNEFGQLGDGTVLQRNAPFQVATSVTDMAAGWVDSVYVKLDTNIFSMGRYFANSFGKLGEGATSARNMPTIVGQMTISLPVIKTQPVSAVTILQGRRATIATTATSTRTLAYQWRKDGVNIVGATSANYDIFCDAAITTSGVYDCVLTNRAGSVRTSTTNVHGIDRPVIVRQPSNIALNEGQTLTLSVLANSEIPMLYQWYMDNTPLTVSSANTDTLSFVAKRIDSGAYSCRVSNAAGESVSEVCSVTVKSAVAPILLTQTLDISIQRGGDALFSVEVQSEFPVVYQWFFNELPLSGANLSSLFIRGVKESDCGRYYVAINNIAGGIISRTVKLSLLPGVPIASISAQPVGGIAKLGGSYILTVIAENASTYQWFKDGILLNGEDRNFLNLTNCAESNSGTYYVIINGTLMSRPAQVTVLISQQFFSNLSTRGFTSSGEKQMIMGVNVVRKARMLLRAAGPTLRKYGLPSAVSGVKLDTVSNNTVIASNSGWMTNNWQELASVGSSVGAFAYDNNSMDSASLLWLETGAYTISAAPIEAAAEGISLCEIYMVPDNKAENSISNVSTRGYIGLDEKELIMGLTLNKRGTVLLRGVGPSLRNLGLSNCAKAVEMEVQRLGQSNTVLGTNSSWDSVRGDVLKRAFLAVGAFPLVDSSKDAALMLTLEPGTYTVSIRPTNGDELNAGIGLAEAYYIEPSAIQGIFNP